MKKQKKFGRKLTLNKETIATLDQRGIRKVIGGADPVPCNRTIPTEVICTLYDCVTKPHITICAESICFPCP